MDLTPEQQRFKDELVKAGYKPQPVAGKGHVWGRIEDLHHTCTKCGQDFSIVSAMVGSDIFPPQVIDCPKERTP